MCPIEVVFIFFDPRFSRWSPERMRMMLSLFALIGSRWKFQAILWRSPWRSVPWRKCPFIKWAERTIMWGGWVFFLFIYYTFLLSTLSDAVSRAALLPVWQNELFLPQSHFKDALQDGLQNSHLEMDSHVSESRDSIMQSRSSSCDSHCSKSTMCSVSWDPRCLTITNTTYCY